MRKFVMVVLVSFVLVAVGAAQAAPMQRSLNSAKPSNTLYIQASSTLQNSYGMVVSEPQNGRVDVMVLYPDIVVSLPVIKLRDGSYAIQAMTFYGHFRTVISMPLAKDQQAQTLVPVIPMVDMLFETSDGGGLYVPNQDPEAWLPNLPIIVAQKI